MARYITDHVQQPNAILTDDSQTLEVMLLSGRPDLFLDRIDHGDMAWRRVLNNPFGRVKYFLLPKWAPGHYHVPAAPYDQNPAPVQQFVAR